MVVGIGGFMYKIGVFSQMTGLTVKALRYYHEQEMLIPIEIDDHFKLFGKEPWEVESPLIYVMPMYL